MSGVKLVRLLSGEELLTEVQYDDGNKIALKNPVLLIVLPPQQEGGKPSISIAPWAVLADQNVLRKGELEINRNVVVYITDPSPQLENEYRVAFGKLIVPNGVSAKPSLFVPQ